MLKKLLAFFGMVVTLLDASSLGIPDDFTYAKASGHMTYIADKNSTYTIETIKQAPWLPMDSTNLGGLNTYPSWTKLTLKNNSATQKNLMLKNPRASMDEIDVYIFKNGHQINTYLLGDNRSIFKRPVAHRYSIVPLSLDVGEEFEVISKLVNRISSTEGEWEVYEHSSFSKFSMLESMWWGLYSGFFLSLLFYLTLLSIVLKDKILVVLFSLYVISTLSYQLAINGILYSFGASEHYINLMTLLFGSFFGLFTVFVVLRFLKISQYKGIIHSILWMFAAALILEILMLLLSFINSYFVQIAAYMSPYVGLFAYLVWFVLLKDFLKISQKGVFRYMFLGYTAIIIAYAYQALTTVGLIEVNFLTTYAVSIGSIVEMYFFALAITLYIEQMQVEQMKQSKLIDYQMRFISIGRVIGNISHQWKIPLVRLGALITHIESIIHDKKGTLQEIEPLIPHIRSSYSFMQHTIDEFHTLYAQPSLKVEFSFSKVINDVWGMLSAKALASNVKLVIKEEKNGIRIESYEHSFAHVMLVLMDNVIDVAKKKAIVNPSILIEISNLDAYVTICIEDNCGGITQKPIESIFEISITDQEDALEKNGLGLSIVKTLVCEKLFGTIEVFNTAQGALFRMAIPKYKGDNFENC